MRTLFQAAALCVVVSIVLTLPALADSNSTVTVQADQLNPVIEFFGLILMGLGGTLIAMLVKLLPGWARPFINAAVQAALANWYRQGIASAIQEIEGFDKNKTISLDVGSSGLAWALRFLIEYAPRFLLKIAGGPEKVKAQILTYFTEHGIVLDQGVTTAAVAEKASLQPVIDKIGGDAGLKKIFTGK